MQNSENIVCMLHIIYGLLFVFLLFLSLSCMANVIDTLGKGINKIRMYASDVKNRFLKACESDWMMYLSQFKGLIVQKPFCFYSRGNCKKGLGLEFFPILF